MSSCKPRPFKRAHVPMIQFQPEVAVYLYRTVVDFRKQINGLSLIVQESMELDVFSESLFVFVNRPRTRIKILYWQRNGFCLWMKRLERDKFAWPMRSHQETVSITTQELQWLLEGFDIWRQPPHQTLHYASV